MTGRTGLEGVSTWNSNDPLATAHQTDINQSISNEGQVFHRFTLLVLLECNAKATVDSHIHFKRGNGRLRSVDIQTLHLCNFHMANANAATFYVLVANGTGKEVDAKNKEKLP